VLPARRRDEVGPDHRAPGQRQPLLRARHVGGALAGTEQAAEDLADRTDGFHLAARNGGHRLVEQRHPLGDAARAHVGIAQGDMLMSKTTLLIGNLLWPRSPFH
jgi:hypothetical protein